MQFMQLDICFMMQLKSVPKAQKKKSNILAFGWLGKLENYLFEFPYICAVGKDTVSTPFHHVSFAFLTHFRAILGLL